MIRIILLARSLSIALLLVAFFSAQGLAQSNVGLAVYLPMNGSTQDASGHNNHGTLAGGVLPTADAAGNFNSAYHFDGNGRIFINDPQQLRGALDAVTILVKVRPDSLPFYTGTSIPFFHVLDWYRTPTPGIPNMNRKMQLLLGCSRGNIFSPVAPAGEAGAFGYYFMNCGNTLASDAGYLKDSTRIINKWFTIAYVFDHGEVRIYFDCQKYDQWVSPVPQFKACDADAPMPLEITLGYYLPPAAYVDNNRNFSGDIDELRIYTRALDDSEIAQYAGTLCIPEIQPAIEVTRPNCVGPVYQITDRSNTNGIPVISRKWVINPGNTTVLSQPSFTHTFTRTGVYTVTLLLQDSAGYRYKEETVIPVVDIGPARDFLKTSVPREYFLCHNQSSVQLKVSGAANYVWEPCTGLSSCDSAVVTATPAATQTYKVKGFTAEGCPDSLSFTIKKSTDSTALFVPTAFTPNGDGVNDQFGVQSSAVAGPLQFEIFNRWGARVFRSNRTGLAWDGTVNGAPQPAGVYTWKLRYTGGDGCSGTVQKGTVVLIR